MVRACWSAQGAGSEGLEGLDAMVGLGDGGVVVTRNPEWAEKVRLFRNLGLRSRDNAVFWSSNSRLDSVQAAMLLVKLARLNEWTEKRRSNAQFYRTR